MFSDELSFMSGRDLENRRELKTMKRGTEHLKRTSVIKENCEANIHNLCSLFSRGSAALLLPPLCFHLSCDVSPTAQTAKNSGSLEHLALMEKGFCRLKRRELKLGLDVGDSWLNVAAFVQQESLPCILSSVLIISTLQIKMSSCKHTFCQVILL